MIFGDLVRQPELGISVLVPGQHALDRQVTGVYITDLPDPSRFLSPGDVVLTSGLWASRPGGIPTFIDAVAGRGVAALIIGLIEIGHIPDEVIALCRERRLTLATISQDVSFKTLSEQVALGQTDSTNGLLARGVRFNHQLAETLGRGGGALAALQLFRDEFSIPCWVVDDVGNVAAVSGTPPSTEHVATVWNHMLDRDVDGPSLVPDADGRPFSVWPVGSSTGGARAGHLVCWGDHRMFSPEVRIVIDALIGALRVELGLSGRWRDSQHDHVAELVRVLVDDSVSPGELSARVRLEGLDPSLPTSVLIAEINGRAFPPAATLELVTRMFATQGRAVIGCVLDARAVLLVNGARSDGETDASAVARLGADSLPMLDGRQLRLGLSDPVVEVGQLSSALAIARERLAHLTGTEPVLFSSASSMQSHRALLRTLGERTLAAFSLEVLDPITLYDAKNGSDLIGTLLAFLDNNGAWMETARQLHLHPNTLRYRVGRIEELSGRSLSSMDDRVDLYLALASYR